MSYGESGVLPEDHAAEQRSSTNAAAVGQGDVKEKEQAQGAIEETEFRARDLLREAAARIHDEVGHQKDLAVQGVTALAKDLDHMAESGPPSGLAKKLVGEASGRARELAQYLEEHEPTELLDSVRSYASRRPIVFLAGAALTGLLAGRLFRDPVSDRETEPVSGWLRLSGDDIHEGEGPEKSLHSEARTEGRANVDRTVGVSAGTGYSPREMASESRPPGPHDNDGPYE